MRELRAARGAYDAIPAARIRLGCLVVAGTSSERALNLYTEAGNTWGECLATFPAPPNRWNPSCGAAGRAPRT
jgi:hypothetical protein